METLVPENDAADKVEAVILFTQAFGEPLSSPPARSVKSRRRELSCPFPTPLGTHRLPAKRPSWPLIPSLAPKESRVDVVWRPVRLVTSSAEKLRLTCFSAGLCGVVKRPGCQVVMETLRRCSVAAQASADLLGPNLLADMPNPARHQSARSYLRETPLAGAACRSLMICRLKPSSTDTPGERRFRR